MKTFLSITAVLLLAFWPLIESKDLTRRRRARAVLDTLLVVSESTQVILFTHENDVRDWARERLAGAADRLVELDRSGIPA